jgi:hypothetical protein
MGLLQSLKLEADSLFYVDVVAARMDVFALSSESNRNFAQIFPGTISSLFAQVQSPQIQSRVPLNTMRHKFQQLPRSTLRVAQFLKLVPQ